MGLSQAKGMARIHQKMIFCTFSKIRGKNAYGEDADMGGIKGLNPNPLEPVIGISDPKSLAFAAGLRTGDTITKIENRSILVFGDLNEALISVWADKKPISISFKRKPTPDAKDVAEQTVSLNLPKLPKENLDLGAIWRKNKKEAQESKARVVELFPRLGERLTQQADTLSGGERQMLAISRALMSKPQLLLLDEPSLGLAPLIVEQIFQTIRGIVDSMGVTVVLVEQNAMGALKIADSGVVLNLGKVVATASAAELIADPAVRAAYLGY